MRPDVSRSTTDRMAATPPIRVSQNAIVPTTAFSSVRITLAKPDATKNTRIWVREVSRTGRNAMASTTPDGTHISDREMANPIHVATSWCTGWMGRMRNDDIRPCCTQCSQFCGEPTWVNTRTSDHAT